MVIRLLRYLLHMGRPLETGLVIRTEAQKDLTTFLSTLGVERLSLEQRQQISRGFAKDFHAGLEGKPSSLATLPSRLSAKVLTKEDIGKRALVVEMGGTNLRAGEIRIVDKEGEVIPEISHHTSLPYQDSSKHYENADAFFSEVAHVAKNIMVDSIDALGVIWSAPGTPIKTTHGVDQKAPRELPKGFVIPGIDEKPLGEQLVAGLEKVAVAVSQDATVAVLNDTVAVLLAGGGKVGGVIGTGFNLAVEYNDQIYNLEAGAFSGLPTTPLSKEVEVMQNPGINPGEKQISGDYVGMQLDTVVEKLSDAGFLPGVKRKEGGKLTATHLSALLSGDKSSIEEVLSGVSNSLFGRLQEVAELLRDRSAQIAGTIIGTLINEIADQLPDNIVIPIEGSFFAKTPRYQEKVVGATQEILGQNVLGKRIVYKPVEQSGMKGAAVAALTVKD